MTEIIRHFDSFGWVLIDVAWKSTALLLLVYALDRLLLKRRPIAADTVWSTAILMLALLPLCCFVLPQFALPMYVSSAEQVESPPGSPFGGEQPQLTTTLSPARHDREVVTPSSTEIAPGEVAIAEPEISTGVEASSSQQRTTLLSVMVLVYCLGIAVAGLRLGAAVYSVARLRRDATMVTSVTWTAIFREYRQRLGIRREVTLCHSPDVSSPLTVGWRRPTVILPSSSLGETGGGAIDVVLLHELTHIARGDYLVHLVSKVAQCIHWYNPLIWLASRRLGRIRETVCDGYCVSLLGDRDRYVGVLFDYARRLAEARHTALGLAMVRVSRLERRLADLVPINRFDAGVTVRLASLLAALLVTMTVAAAAIAEPTMAAAPGPESGSDRQLGAKQAETTSQVEELDLIIEGLKRGERSIKSLVVSHLHEVRRNLTKPGSPLPTGISIEDDAVSSTLKGTVSWEVELTGRGRLEAEYLKTNTRFDGSQVKKREAIASTYDGTMGEFVTTSSTESGVVISRDRRRTDRLIPTSRSPFDFSTHHLGKPISDSVSEKGGKIVERETWEQRPVVVIEAARVTVRPDYIYRQRFWIDPSRNHLVVRRQTYVQRGEGKPWGLHFQITLSENEEVSPGIWLPKKVDLWNYHVTASGQDHLVSREYIKVTEWLVNKTLNDSRFKIEPGIIDQIGTPTVAADAPAAQTSSRKKSQTAPQPEKVPDGFRLMTLRTTDSQGKPVPNTGIYVNISPEEPYKTSNREYTTDVEGHAEVLVPDPPRLFRIWTQKRGFVPLFAQWWPEHQPDGHIIPEEFTLSLPNGTEIGGVVKNAAGDPIEGAIVEVMLANRVDERGRRPVPSIWLAEIPSPGKNPCVTDAEGVWRLNNVPEGDDVHIRLKLTHPQYISDTRWGGLQEEQSILMEAFRDRSATIVMHHGIGSVP